MVGAAVAPIFPLAVVLVAVGCVGQARAGSELEEIARRIRDGQFDTALALTEPMLSRSPADPRLWTLKGLALAGLGRAAESLDCYERALELDPGSLATLQAKAELEYRTGRPGARETLRRLLERSPANPVAHAMVASLAFAEGDCRTALAHFEKAETAISENAGALHQFGYCLAAAGRAEEAQVRWKRALKLAPEEEGYYLDLARLHAESGALSAALDVLAAGVGRLPASAPLRVARGVFLVLAGRFDEAETEFEEANRLSPDRQLGTVGLSYASTQWQQRLDKAIAQARRSLARNPADPLLNYLLAEALLRKGAEPGTPAFEEARRSLGRSIEGAPEFAKARTALAKTELVLGRPREAIEHLEIAVKADPTDQIALSTLVTALQRAGRPEEARAAAGRLRALLAAEREADLRRSRRRPVP